MKCKYSDIKEIQNWFNNYAGRECYSLKGQKKSYYQVGYYTPAAANWSYELGLVKHKGELYMCVITFGTINAAMPIILNEI